MLRNLTVRVTNEETPNGCETLVDKRDAYPKYTSGTKLLHEVRFLI